MEEMTDLNGFDWDKLVLGVSAFWSSLVRTVTPGIVGWLASLLVTLGVPVDDELRGALQGLLALVLGAVYYIVVRLLERVYGWASWLLLSGKQPVAYGTKSS